MDMKFRDKLAIIFGLVLLLCITLMVIFSTHKTSDTINQDTSKAFMTALRQANSNIDTQIKNLERMINTICINTDLQELLAKDNGDIYERYLSHKQISDFVQLMLNTYEISPKIRIYVKNTTLITDNQFIFDMEKIKDENWYGDALNKKSGVFWTEPYQKTLGEGIQIEMICGVKLLRNFLSNNILGFITVEVSADKVFGNLKTMNLGDTGRVFLLNSNGHVLYSSGFPPPQDETVRGAVLDKLGEQSSGSFLSTWENKKTLFVYDGMNVVGWKLVGAVPEAEISKRSGEVTGFIYMVAFVFISVGIVVIFLFSHYITRKIYYLTDRIKLVAMGNFDIDVELAGNDELSDMARKFKEMVSQLKTLISDKQTAAKKQHELELKALQAQIQPHFLYNTLSTINSMALDIEAQDISSALVNLSRYYKLTLSNGADVIRIRDEIEHVKAYLSIQNLKLRNKLKIIYDIDGAILNCLTVKVILQPFIENAIIHGFEMTKGVGTITITAKKSQKLVVFNIIDDGKGIQSENPDFYLSVDTKGYGVKNVNEKIKLYFGDEYGVKLESRAGNGTKVTITIPLLESEV